MAGDWWAGVELRHLVALDAVAREGSFRRAAERLGYVQSAISHQIAALESLVGQRLIDRSRGTRPLMLTPAGEVLLSHATAVIGEMRAAQADLNGAGRTATGRRCCRTGAAPDLRQADRVSEQPERPRPEAPPGPFLASQLSGPQLEQAQQMRRPHEGVAQRRASVEGQRRHDLSVHLGDHEPAVWDEASPRAQRAWRARRRRRRGRAAARSRSGRPVPASLPRHAAAAWPAHARDPAFAPPRALA